MAQNIGDFNKALSAYSWMDFELFLENGELILSGGIDEAEPENLRISFSEPYMVACPICFTYDEGALIEEVFGKQFAELTEKYKIPDGYRFFRFYINNDLDSFFIIAKDFKFTA